MFYKHFGSVNSGAINGIRVDALAELPVIPRHKERETCAKQSGGDSWRRPY